MVDKQTIPGQFLGFPIVHHKKTGALIPEFMSTICLQSYLEDNLMAVVAGEAVVGGVVVGEVVV